MSYNVQRGETGSVHLIHSKGPVGGRHTVPSGPTLDHSQYLGQATEPSNSTQKVYNKHNSTGVFFHLRQVVISIQWHYKT